MKDNFRRVKRILKSNSSISNIVAVNGCCYGKAKSFDKGDYLKLCGQRFWEFISGNGNLYIEIIEPLGFEAKQRNDSFHEEYSRIINLFTMEFQQQFCEDGKIIWEKKQTIPIKVFQVFEEEIHGLEAGKYRLEVHITYGNERTEAVQLFEIKPHAKFLPAVELPPEAEPLTSLFFDFLPWLIAIAALTVGLL